MGARNSTFCYHFSFHLCFFQLYEEMSREDGDFEPKDFEEMFREDGDFEPEDFEEMFREYGDSEPEVFPADSQDYILRAPNVYEIEKEVHSLFAGTLKFSWLGYGVLTEIRNQGGCGCCWTMPTTGSIESNYMINSVLSKDKGEEELELIEDGIEELQLAPQHLLDCLHPHPDPSTTDEKGCYGASLTETYSFIEKKCLYKEEDYPFTGEKGECRCPKLEVDRYYINGRLAVDSTDETMIKVAILQNPIAAVITLTKEKHEELMHLSNGDIFYGNTESEIKAAIKKDKRLEQKTVKRHALLFVGYGESYYLVKNSWGFSWGFRGFGRVACSSCFSQMEIIDVVSKEKTGSTST